MTLELISEKEQGHPNDNSVVSPQPPKKVFVLTDEHIMVAAMDMAVEQGRGTGRKMSEIIKESEISDEDLTQWSWGEIESHYGRRDTWPSIRQRAMMLKNGASIGLPDIDCPKREDEEIVYLSTMEFLEVLRSQQEDALKNCSWEEIETLPPQIRMQAIKLKNTGSAA